MSLRSTVERSTGPCGDTEYWVSLRDVTERPKAGRSEALISKRSRIPTISTPTGSQGTLVSAPSLWGSKLLLPPASE